MRVYIALHVSSTYVLLAAPSYSSAVTLLLAAAPPRKQPTQQPQQSCDLFRLLAKLYVLVFHRTCFPRLAHTLPGRSAAPGPPAPAPAEPAAVAPAALLIAALSAISIVPTANFLHTHKLGLAMAPPDAAAAAVPAVAAAEDVDDEVASAVVSQSSDVNPVGDPLGPASSQRAGAR